MAVLNSHCHVDAAQFSYLVVFDTVGEYLDEDLCEAFSSRGRIRSDWIGWFRDGW